MFRAKRRILSDAAKKFPSVASVSMRESLATLGALLGKLSIAIQSAASLAFVVSALVLSGALAAGQRARIYEAVVLKVLGATRKRLFGGADAGIRASGRGDGGFRPAGGEPRRMAGGDARCWTWTSNSSRCRRRRSRWRR